MTTVITTQPTSSGEEPLVRGDSQDNADLSTPPDQEQTADKEKETKRRKENHFVEFIDGITDIEPYVRLPLQMQTLNIGGNRSDDVSVTNNGEDCCNCEDQDCDCGDCDCDDCDCGDCDCGDCDCDCGDCDCGDCVIL